MKPFPIRSATPAPQAATRLAGLLRWALALVLAVLVAGCDLFYAVIGARDLEGLAYVSVEIADLRDRSEIEWSEPRPSRTLVMVTFKSPVDLRGYAHRYSSTISPDAWFCSEDWQGPTKQLATNPLADDMGEIIYPDEDEELNTKPPYIYRMCIFSEFHNQDWVGLSPTSLQEQPGDVCFDVSGGNMLSRRYESNIMVVPRQEILDAFARAGLL